MNFVCDSQQMRSRGLWSREARIAEFRVTAEHCGAELFHMAARIAGPAEQMTSSRTLCSWPKSSSRSSPLSRRC
jgi:hypothetical protein